MIPDNRTPLRDEIATHIYATIQGVNYEADDRPEASPMASRDANELAVAVLGVVRQAIREQRAPSTSREAMEGFYEAIDRVLALFPEEQQRGENPRGGVQQP